MNDTIIATIIIGVFIIIAALSIENYDIYGEMWYHNRTGTTIQFFIADTFYPLFFTNSSLNNGFSFNGGFNTTSSLTANTKGIYHTVYSASGSGQNNHIYYSTILINDIEQNKCDSHKKMTAGGDIVTMNGNCLIYLNENDVVKVATSDFDDTGEGIYYSAYLSLIRIRN